MYWEQRLNHGKELECIVSIVETYCLFFIHPPLLGTKFLIVHISVRFKIYLCLWCICKG